MKIWNVENGLLPTTFELNLGAKIWELIPENKIFWISRHF